jgi:hypothetical protein
MGKAIVRHYIESVNNRDDKHRSRMVIIYPNGEQEIVGYEFTFGTANYAAHKNLQLALVHLNNHGVKRFELHTPLISFASELTGIGDSFLAKKFRKRAALYGIELAEVRVIIE